MLSNKYKLDIEYLKKLVKIETHLTFEYLFYVNIFDNYVNQYVVVVGFKKKS